MTVFERTREFGVMMALGTSPGRIVGVVLGEALWLSLLGVSAGLALGVAANAVTQVWGIPVGEGPITYGGVSIETMHAANTFAAVFLAPAVVFASGVLAAVFPSVRAARLRPVDAIREF
jgi:ABC-type antimicrobial peptide transport system permease subunit